MVVLPSLSFITWIFCSHWFVECCLVLGFSNIYLQFNGVEQFCFLLSLSCQEPHEVSWSLTGDGRFDHSCKSVSTSLLHCEVTGLFSCKWQAICEEIRGFKGREALSIFEEEGASGEAKLGKITESMESWRLGRSGVWFIHSFIPSCNLLTKNCRSDSHIIHSFYSVLLCDIWMITFGSVTLLIRDYRLQKKNFSYCSKQ